MKVLQINSVIDYGSTGRIARDLYDYLENKGHECLIAFGRGKATPGYKTIKIGSQMDQRVHGVYSRLADRHGFGSRQVTRKFVEQIEHYNPDIIQLHNIHGYYLNIKVLFEYLAQKDIPVVWLLHDQWAISGHSANFNLNLDGTLPVHLSSREELKNYPKTLGWSQFERNLRDKEHLFTLPRKMTLITPSQWLAAIVNQSYLRKYEVKTIYNGINRDIFHRDDSKTGHLRKQWASENKIVVLGAASVWDERKGLDDFVELVKRLPENQYQIVLVGIDKKTKAKLPDTIISIERTNSVEELREIYNASDVFVNPTYFDNFPTVNIEALACGTPVITYDTGGSPESISQGTGSVVEQGDLNLLKAAIRKWGKKSELSSKRCEKYAEKHFTKELTYSKYEKLYVEVLEKEKVKYK